MAKVQVYGETVSRANRVYKIFKPSEVVEGEIFDLKLTFTNVGEKFYGGNFKLVFTQEKREFPNGRHEVPQLEVGESVTLKIPDLRLHSSGPWGMEFRDQHCYKTDNHATKGEVFLFTLSGTALHYHHFIAFSVASKEEVYQKYALVIALAAFVISIVALLIAIVDVLDGFI